MKTAVYNSKYFIAIGFFIFLCFTGMGLFMTSKFKERTQRISIDMATKIYQLKSTVIRSEFQGFIKGMGNAAVMVPLLQSESAFFKEKHLINSLLLSHPKITTGWYVIVSGRDTLYQSVTKKTGVDGGAPIVNYNTGAVLSYQKDWIRTQLNRTDTATRRNTLISVNDSLHCLVGSKHRLAGSSVLMFGLDINFNELQHYLWTVDSTSRASAFIVGPNRHYLTNQDEKLIGKKVPDTEKMVGTTFLSDSVSSYEIVNSAYLQVPVVRFYTPLEINGMNCTMVVDTPVFVIDEDVNAIEKYVLVMFIITALIILGLIGWSQAKWQREFMMRQEAELTAERKQKENAMLQLDKLKEKVNPHFLFNSLSSLNGLIEAQPELAKSFVVKLSRVYRYVLDPSPGGLEEVSKELRFASEYFFLLKIRFGEALAPLVIDLSPAHAAGYIPFMSLQTLLENAVKHNIVSRSSPLHITIKSEGEGIVVTNNLQLRNDVKDSGKQGLNYLRSVYAHFGDYHLTSIVENDVYSCVLPVIKIVSTP